MTAACGARTDLGAEGDPGCVTGDCDPELPQVACQDLHERDPSLPSGPYDLEANGTLFRGYCDMTGDGGGWTLVLKADGNESTFAFDAPAWTGVAPFGTAPFDLSRSEAKLEAYDLVAFREIRVVMASSSDDDDAMSVVADLRASSLGESIRGAFVALDVERDEWLALAPGAQLQSHCNVSGINARGEESGHARARIGMIANQEDDCRTPDSFVGVGTSMAATDTTVGAYCDAFWCATGGSIDLPAFAYVFVR